MQLEFLWVYVLYMQLNYETIKVKGFCFMCILHCLEYLEYIKHTVCS